MNNLDKYIEQLKPLLAKVGEEIGKGAEFGWKILIKQQYVIVAQNLVGVLAGIAGLIVTYKLIKEAIKVADANKGKDYYNGEDVFAYIIPSIFLGFGSAVALIVCLTIVVSHAINPAYYALQDIINLVK